MPAEEHPGSRNSNHTRTEIPKSMVCLNDKWDAGEQSTKGEERNHGGEVGPRPEV